MPELATYPWAEPLEVAAFYAEAGHALALLYSARAEPDGATGRYSYLALDPVETVEGEHINALEAALARTPNTGGLTDRWFGYVGYACGVGNREDTKTGRQEKKNNDFPLLRFTRFATVLVFDHDARVVRAEGGQSREFRVSSSAKGRDTELRTLHSEYSLSHPTYLATVTRTLEEIRAGNFYQANITRECRGEWQESPDSFALFRALCEVSPAPYAAYLGFGECAILSSSPECFLRMDRDGGIETRPIKGSAGRGENTAEDAALAEALAASPKERAENLMIVDLMRNDLARICAPGSVEVAELCAVKTYPTIHHMVSTVRGKRREGATLGAMMEATFPPGSMTGAPKIAAMEWIAQQEPVPRGVYSGALGWLAPDGTGELSVVIRTLILSGNRYSYHSGGAITADSSPEAEWAELLLKAHALERVLGG